MTAFPFPSPSTVLNRYEEKSFPIKVTIDIHRSEIKHYEYTVDYADMCYAVADACTKALKKHGFNGYHNCHPFFRCRAEWR